MRQKRESAKSRLDDIYTILDGIKNRPMEYDDQIVRQLLECVVVDSKEQITVIFKGGLKIYINSKGEWTTVSGGGDEINIEYLEKEVINSIKKEFPNEKVIYVKKQKNAYKIKFKNRTNITVDFEGNIKKGRRDY